MKRTGSTVSLFELSFPLQTTVNVKLVRDGITNLAWSTCWVGRLKQANSLHQNRQDWVAHELHGPEGSIQGNIEMKAIFGHDTKYSCRDESEQ